MSKSSDWLYDHLTAWINDVWVNRRESTVLRDSLLACRPINPQLFVMPASDDTILRIVMLHFPKPAWMEAWGDSIHTSLEYKVAMTEFAEKRGWTWIGNREIFGTIPGCTINYDKAYASYHFNGNSFYRNEGSAGTQLMVPKWQLGRKFEESARAIKTFEFSYDKNPFDL